ncbi:alpha-tubulin suppressor [Solibacillus silvestris StLB046]|uniref:Alpha-tubulin suppressor n=2 Tax=Caryophanaceae TaxID=186818 RepID=F2F3W4_SOLSS|nr:alpha-tubulin suppressor [Solibacillus silvestris StLB046]
MMAKHKAIYIMLIMMLTLSTLLPFVETAEAYGVTNHEDVVDVGKNHFIVLKEDGSVWGWGDHSYGQLGANGSNTSSPIPIQKADGNRLLNIKAIAAGSNHTVALDRNGEVWTWGRNNQGQLGYTTANSFSNLPAKVTGITSKIIAISAGEYHTLAVDENGQVWAWGRNDYGQIGTDCNPALAHVQVCGVSGIIAVAAGDNHSVALKSDGTVWAWGRNTVGQLGNGETTDINTNPTAVPGLSNIVDISAGANHTLALKQDSTSIYAWGFNSSGQLGDGGLESKLRPIQVEGMNKVKTIAAGNNHSIAIKEDGTVWTWGRHTSGTSSNRSTPIQVKGLSSAIAIGGGGDSDSYILAVKEDGTVWQWDKASSDSTTKLPIFKQVSGIDEVMKPSEFPFVQGSQVLFRYIGNAGTSSVEVYGNFNEWNSIPLDDTGSNNVWELQVTLQPGEYIYGFKVNGVWTVDPLNPNKTIDMNDGSPYSVLKVAPYAVEGPIISNKEVTFTYSSYDFNGELELDAKTAYVAVIGDFTAWREVPLTKQANNVWTLKQTLEPGDHAYSFIVSDASTGPRRVERNDPLNKNIGTNAVTDIPRNRFFVSEDVLSTIPVSGITLNKGPKLNLIVGETTTLNATVLPTNATNKNVSWSSSDAKVVSVNETGRLTAHTAGTAVIAVSTVDGGKLALVTVTVEKRADAISYPRVGYKNMGDRTGVNPTKTWYIKFNQQLDLASLNENAAYILDESGDKIPVGYQLSNDGKTLEIRPQNGITYKKGANHYLFIESTVKTKYGLQLREPVQMKFTIEL